MNGNSGALPIFIEMIADDRSTVFSYRDIHALISLIATDFYDEYSLFFSFNRYNIGYIILFRDDIWPSLMLLLLCWLYESLIKAIANNNNLSLSTSS